MEAVSVLGLKRRFEEVDSPCSTPKDSDDDISSNDSRDSCDSLNSPTSSLIPTSILRRHKTSLGQKQVRFDAVTVYYFSRRQGFTSVPSQGGSSLGMARHHCAIRQYTLGEFAVEQESSHRHILRQHLRQEKLNARKMKMTRNGTVQCAQADLLTLEDVSDEDLDVNGVEVDDCFFLQPLPTKRRRALLRASGIACIDAREKMELRAIRLSREECGCDCRFYCDPLQCGCSRAGIKCQVDRLSFPCGCSRDGCRNAAGRIEFNPLRVRTHYLHTIMKLDREKEPHLGSTSGENCEEETEVNLSPSCCSSLFGAEQELLVVTPSEQELLEEQCNSLEHENETAVLHLQSAEEQERIRELEEEVLRQEVHNETSNTCVLQEGPCSHEEMETSEEVQGVLLQDSFSEEATLLCVKENQKNASNPNEPTSVLFYHIEDGETAVIGRKQEPQKEVENETKSKHEPKTCRQDKAGSSITNNHSPSFEKEDEENCSTSKPHLRGTDCQGNWPQVEVDALNLPPEV